MLFRPIIFALFVFLSLFAHNTQELDERIPVCLKEYPVDPVMFNDNVSPFVQKIIKKHGIEEFKAVFLTNELHRHLGMWSIVGAKMGIYARELLGAAFDEVNVISFCGLKPPFSCTNDGIQVSTGASLGRGTITNAHIGKPEAIFHYKKDRILLKVKPEIVEQIKSVIKKLSEEYGFQTERYFRELDKVSVKYWLKWERAEMFDEVHLD